MLNDLDDLFRQELAGHASEPGADLWARLQARTTAEATGAADTDPVDARFRAGLAGHATPPQRELWERLEDEHLRPRQRRRPVVAWGRLAVAASLLLLVLAGGAGLWWGYWGQPAGPVAATAQAVGDAAPKGAVATRQPAGAVATTEAETHTAAPPAVGAFDKPLLEKNIPAKSLAAAISKAGQSKKNQKIISPQATGPAGSPSSSPVASTTGRRRAATAPPAVPGLPNATPQPDAASGILARTGGRNTLGGQPLPQPETPALAAASPQVIEVEVRRGAASQPAPVVAVAAAPAAFAAAGEPRPRLRLGGLLRQAGHALRGEQVSLAEATGLPEAVTLQAHLGDRVLSKTIRL